MSAYIPDHCPSYIMHCLYKYIAHVVHVESKMNFMLLCNAHSMMMYDPAALILYMYYLMNLTN